MVARVRADGLLAPGRSVIVLLSGGRDSTCLLDVAARVAGADAVGALHVNYGLRALAGEDERHCAALCRQLGVPLQVHRPAPRARGNLQGWAREVRYRAGRELAQGRGADLAAGHTATDQAETILYRVASSPSRRALLGMRSREGSLVRPLLPFTREETAAYCRARGLSWREDESNATGTYARNRVRGDLLPALARDPSGRRTERARAGRGSARRGRGARRAGLGRVGSRRDPDLAGASARAPGRAAAAGRPTPGRRGGWRLRTGGRAAGRRAGGAPATEGLRCSTSGVGCGRWSSTASCASRDSSLATRRRRRPW